MTEEQVRKLLLSKAKKHAKNRGSTGMRAWCEHHGVNVGHASEFMNGNRCPGNDVLDALGLEWRIVIKKRPRSRPTRG